MIEINCTSFYIKLITEFSEASTYDLLALYKNLCVCVAALEHFLLLFFSPIETWYPWTVSPVSTNKQWGLQPWNVASWLAKPARAFTSWSVMSFYPVSWCFQKQAEINTGTLLPMWFNPSLGSQWKNVETVLKWKGSTRKQYQKKKEKKNKQESLLSSTLNQYSTLLFCPFIEILLSQKKHLSTAVQCCQFLHNGFFPVLNMIPFEATQHPLKLVPRDSNFKEIVHTSKQQQNLQTPVW